MARLVEDSDDEFPELAVIIGRCQSGAGSKTSPKNQLQSPMEKPICYEAVVISTDRDPRTSSDKFSTVPMGSVSERAKSKRRVLNKICVNPLLQPFSSLKDGAPMHRSGSISELRKKNKFTASDFEEKCKPTSCRGFDSSLENDLSIAGSIGLSDFIVNDNSFLEEDSMDKEIVHRALGSNRRLFQGRRSPGSDTADENRSDPNVSSGVQKNLITPTVDNERFTENNETGKVPPVTRNASSKAILRGAGIVTPPLSPLKTERGLLSPKKGAQIPRTPHRASMDAFWDPGVINEWNDEYSPQKSVIPQNHIINDRLEAGLPRSSAKKSQVTLQTNKFRAKNLFTLKKRDIAGAFLRELDESVTNGKIAEMAALTGGISIIWSKKLNTTAGRANWRREAVKATAREVEGKSDTNVTYRHYASIELAEKVINNEDRLLNVIAHEFCHLANFMISGNRNNPHGKDFKIWAAKCSKLFGNRGIKVTTKHSYEIDYKYAWECTNCGTEFKRHSKSINPMKHQCASCKSKLVQTKPIPRPRVVMSEYQLFVKENMRKVKEQNPGSPQKQIMAVVGKMYQDFKASKPTSPKEDENKTELSDGNNDQSREGTPNEGDVDSVMKKLSFLNLISPCVDIHTEF